MENFTSFTHTHVRICISMERHIWISTLLIFPIPSYQFFHKGIIDLVAALKIHFSSQCVSLHAWWVLLILTLTHCSFFTIVHIIWVLLRRCAFYSHCSAPNFLTARLILWLSPFTVWDYSVKWVSFLFRCLLKLYYAEFFFSCFFFFLYLFVCSSTLLTHFMCQAHCAFTLMLSHVIIRW